MSGAGGIARLSGRRAWPRLTPRDNEGAGEMAETALFEAGGYRYMRGPFQYSGGVAAEPGFAIERVRFATPQPMQAGFAAIEAHLRAIGRPFTAFCACELRSPAPFTEQGFTDFNRVYVGTLERWGIFKDEENPVARSNVCPEIAPPPEPSFYAFSYTVPAPADARPSFVISGAGESKPGDGGPETRIVRHGDRSPEAMLEKARHVHAAMETRMGALGLNWGLAGATQVYTVYDLHPFLADEIVARGAAAAGLTWHYARPPIENLDYEMDVGGVSVERVI